ncbi:MAG: hypothetical protein WEB29_03535 [Chloroflexota bacterium]
MTDATAATPASPLTAVPIWALAYFNGGSETINVTPVAVGGTLGTGTATLDDRGDTATVTIEATTEDGIEISATMECHSIKDY